MFLAVVHFPAPLIFYCHKSSGYYCRITCRSRRRFTRLNSGVMRHFSRAEYSRNFSAFSCVAYSSTRTSPKSARRFFRAACRSAADLGVCATLPVSSRISSPRLHCVAVASLCGCFVGGSIAFVLANNVASHAIHYYSRIFCLGCCVDVCHVFSPVRLRPTRHHVYIIHCVTRNAIDGL